MSLPVLKSLEQRVDPSVAALIVVDYQNDFCHADGACAKAGMDVRAAGAIAPALGRLVQGARRAGVPVVWIQSVYNADMRYLSAVWLEQARRRWRGLYNNIPVCEPGSWGGDFHIVRPEPGEAVVHKHRFSAFRDTDLSIVLRALDARALIFAGVATNVCVESTVREAFFHDYYNVICSDCVAGFDAEAHTVSLRIMDWGFGEVVPGSEVLKIWSSADRSKAA